MGALVLFGDPPPEPPAPAPVVGVRWDTYQSKNRVRCHHCELALRELGEEAPPARGARYRRRTSASDEFLCYDHARDQRRADGLSDLRAPRGA